MVVLVTGASRGIGRALAVAAAREGHDVVVNYLKNAAQANALVSELACCPCRVIAIQADVSAADQAKRLVETTVERLGRIDCVVINRRAALVGGLAGSAISCFLIGHATTLLLFTTGMFSFWIFTMFLYCYLLGTAAVGALSCYGPAV
jgi:NAD(P)-dependent dehydrogenase (short-subunit alcohol dehydrogenase family)